MALMFLLYLLYAPGSVSDLLFKAELSMSVSTAASMYSHYFLNNDLKLTVSKLTRATDTCIFCCDSYVLMFHSFCYR